MTRPRVVVLLATFNGAAFVSEQIATIRAQEGVAVRIVVRDDGSTDATVNILAEEADACRPVEMFDKGGYSTGSAARNFLKMLSEVNFEDADYVALADQDDFWLSGKLRRAIECLNLKGAAGYSSDLVAFDNEGRVPPWLIRKHGSPKLFDHLFQGASAGCTYVITRTAADALKYWLATVHYPNSFGVSHDWLIHAFVRSQGLLWVYDDRAPILYRQHSSNVYGSQQGVTSLRNRIRLLRDRWYRRHIVWIGDQLELPIGEARLIMRLRRMAFVDRFWLLWHAGQLRRRWADVIKLRLAIVTGLF